jgi:hypothetical protein
MTAELKRLFLAVVWTTTFAAVGCDRKPGTESKSGGASAAPATVPVAAMSDAAPASRPSLVGGPAAPGILFTEITGPAGFPDRPAPYADGTYATPEITPGGVAMIDTQNSGRLDLLLICHPSPGPGAFQQTAPNRLFRQDASGKFMEVPGAAGLAGKGYHHGVAVGDIDNDGFADVFIANYAAPDQLFHNNGDGTFTDITAKSGIKPIVPPEQNWTSTAAFVDYDGDGFLDLVVVHFATFEAEKICQGGNDAADRDYCGPHMFRGQLITLYHNNKDGTFTDVTRAVGLDAPGRGWGVIAAPITSDTASDILQANDEEPNQLWVNGGDGKFIDEAVLRGVAFNAAGSVEANMGITTGDVFNRGALDVFITHITSETNTLFKNNGDGTFGDVTAQAGMSAIDRPFTGWGCALLDFDNDGNLDLAVVNGRVAKGTSREDTTVGKFWSRYAEPNLLFRGDGAGHFTDVSKTGGTFTSRPEVHRALAVGDLFNRGRLDMVTMNLDNTLRIFRNDAAPDSNHWVQFLPMIGKREALGAKLWLTSGGKRRTAVCIRAYSYLASNDPRVHFGLGSVTKVDDLEVAWPSGTPRKERFEINGVDRLFKIEQGKGKAIAS